MLQGLGGIVQPREEGSYEPGRQACTLESLDSIMEACQGIARESSLLWDCSTDKERFRHHTRNVRMLLAAGDRGEFSGQEMLDAMIFRVGGTRGSHPQDSFFHGYILSTVIQALYDLGHNGLVLDLSLYHESLECIAGISGFKDDPLRLTCRGDVQSFGYGSSWCELELIGDASDIGTHATDCTFTALGSRGYAGHDSRRSIYHVASLDAVSPAAAAACAFYIHEDNEGACEGILDWLGKKLKVTGKMRALKKCHFFDPLSYTGKNALYVPDGRGGWKEVRP